MGHGSRLVDYDKIIAHKIQLLRQCYEAFKISYTKTDMMTFKEDHHWIEEYSLFMALKDVHNNRPWQEWSNEYKTRDKKALTQFKRDNADEIEFWVFIQWQFFKQWQSLKAYANKRNRNHW